MFAADGVEMLGAVTQLMIQHPHPLALCSELLRRVIWFKFKWKKINSWEDAQCENEDIWETHLNPDLSQNITVDV